MIPAGMHDQWVQLATPSKDVAPGSVEDALKVLIASKKYYFDMKLDGVRCLAFIERGTVRLINRRKADITFRYPEIVEYLAHAFADTDMVLDGEVTCFKDGRPNFERVHRRDAQSNAISAKSLVASMPASFVAFDILCNDGDDVRFMPYAARRALLQTMAQVPNGPFADGVTLRLSMSSTDGQMMWNFVIEHGLEGLIAKLRTTPYRAGRAKAWVKLKPIASLSAVAVGYDYGKGARANTIGAINLALIKDGAPVSVGRVGTGFNEDDLASIKKRMDAKELLVLEVEYQNWYPDTMALRFPSFKGVRNDVEPSDCTVDQLDPAFALKGR